MNIRLGKHCEREREKENKHKNIFMISRVPLIVDISLFSVDISLAWVLRVVVHAVFSSSVLC